VGDRPLGSQGTVCAGGRYDGLIEQIGGKPAPAVGWGLGIERVLALLEDGGVAVPAAVPTSTPWCPTPRRCRRSSRRWNCCALGVTVQMHAGGKDGQGSFKSQFKKADASGARHALIFGADELAQGMVTVKPLRDAAAQVQRPLAELAVGAPACGPGAEA
jgi:histidyl-tRNA synthetase